MKRLCLILTILWAATSAAEAQKSNNRTERAEKPERAENNQEPPSEGMAAFFVPVPYPCIDLPTDNTSIEFRQY